MAYADPGAAYYEDRYRQRVLSNLQRRAKSLGFVLHGRSGPAPDGCFLGNLKNELGSARPPVAVETGRAIVDRRGAAEKFLVDLTP